jgi:hypothetical protein
MESSTSGPYCLPGVLREETSSFEHYLVQTVFGVAEKDSWMTMGLLPFLHQSLEQSVP